MRSSFRSTLIASTLVAASFLAACGGDDGASSDSGQATSIEEFCQRIEALESAAAPDDMGAAVAAIEGLVDSAPTDDVRNALETLVPVLSRMSEIDQNDPDAIGELMGLAMDPEIMAASAVLETFGTEQCGFTEDDLTTEESVPEFSFDEGADPAVAIFETSTIWDYLDATATEYLNGGSFTSVTVLGEGAGYVVNVDASSSGGVAAVPICELLAEFFDTNAPDVDVRIELATEGITSVIREPGGICES